MPWTTTTEGNNKVPVCRILTSWTEVSGKRSTAQVALMAGTNAGGPGTRGRFPQEHNAGRQLVTNWRCHNTRLEYCTRGWGSLGWQLRIRMATGQVRIGWSLRAPKTETRNRNPNPKPIRVEIHHQNQTRGYPKSADKYTHIHMYKQEATNNKYFHDSTFNKFNSLSKQI